ncbi:unnamed protein product [Mycena citricolor]|uniref:Uncharacterized protein n=1 Tax=Mycena citricolor TaxID=2018698 RepID=A0AAD2Q7G9_9AGAR|nr:unnamed protein product [Mycena citricolor]
MTILDNAEQDSTLMKLWGLVTELSEQLNQNRDVSATIYQQAGGIKAQAIHSQTGFVLRRFNQDKPKDIYDAELERMNNTMMLENISLLQDNKQLNGLIREYEQTLENFMSTFRNRAKDVQERELALSREYESRLAARQEECDSQDLATSTALYGSLRRLAHVLRQLIREQNGEPADHASISSSQVDTTPPDTVEDREPWTTLAAREPWSAPDVTGADYALEREIELGRLEKENEQLRVLLGLLPAQPQLRVMEHQIYGSSLHMGHSPRLSPPIPANSFNKPRLQGMVQPPLGSLPGTRRQAP